MLRRMMRREAMGIYKNKRITQAGVNREMRSEYDTLHSQYGGYHNRKVLVSLKRKTAPENREERFAVHLATALKDWCEKTLKRPEIEIQIAMYRERFVISCNKNASVEAIYEDFIKDESRKFSEKLVSLADSTAEAARRSQALEAFRVRRHATKLSDELSGRRDGLGALNLAGLINQGKDLCIRFDASTDIGKQFADFLSGEISMLDKRVALIMGDGMDSWHAEQKILIGLCKAVRAGFRPLSASILFAGTFRPCRGCWESLNLVQKFCLPHIQFGGRPGHFWQTTSKAHVEIIRLLRDGGYIGDDDLTKHFRRDGTLKGMNTTSTHRMYLRTRKGGRGEEALHYNSDSGSDLSDDDSEPD